MTNDAAKQQEEWNREIQREKAVGQYPKWPNEVMLKLLFGGKNYLAEPVNPRPEWRVLDVGCGFGNNLVPFSDIGCDCHGADIHAAMAATAQEVMNKRGFKAQFRQGSNRSLPYPDGHFDLVLSVNTLHYEGTEELVMAALREFRRVLKPGGVLYLSTVGPAHEIYRRAELIGQHRYIIRDFGFRSGQEFFFFDNERYLQHYGEKVFSSVEVARVSEQLMKLPLDFLIAVCR